MRPLNRPMFKYGGPIKEGIMSGMKDKAALVGNPMFPKASDGRAKHAAPAVIPVGMGLNALRIAAMRMAPRAIQGIKNLFRTQVGTRTVSKAGPTYQMPGGNVYSKGFPGGKIPAKTIGPGTAQVPVMGSTKLGSYFASDPLISTGSKVVQGLISPTSKGLIQKGARIVLSPTGIATGLYYAGGKFFDGDGNEKDPPNEEVVLGDRVGTSGAPGGGDPDMFLTPRTKEDPKKTKSEENEALKQKYYKIMGLDKMKKDAVYDSLIDASKIVSEEGGDLKGSIKSGTLQNKIIQAISGQLDKSAALKKQIDAAILKGEIEKDIKASDPKAAKQSELLEKQIAIADKTLSGDTLQETVNKVYERTGAFPSGTSLAAVARTKGIEITSTADTTELTNYKNENKGKNEIDFLEEIVAKGGASDGNYVVGNRILVVQGGKVIPYL